MTDKDYTAIKVIVDRSGSMQDIRTDAEGALSAFIEQQAKEPGRATISLSQFDDTYDTVYKSVDLNDAPVYDLHPRGSTALNDAMGRGIVEFGEELSKMSEVKRPEHVIFIVITDGMENASHEYNIGKVREMVTRQESKYNWTFIFLAANQDAVLTGHGYGLHANSSITFAGTHSGLANTSALLNTYVGTTRAGFDYQITKEDREAAVEKD